MALLKFGRTQDVSLIVEKSKKLDFDVSSSVHEFLSLSPTASTRGKYKRTKLLKNRSSFTTDPHQTTAMEKENIYSNRTSGLTPSAKRLHMSCSASASPIKSIVIPKRPTRSLSSSPCETLGTHPLGDNLDDISVRRHKSTDNQCILSDLSSIVPSPNIFSNGIFDFTMCDQCSDLRSQSLDSWMDHLGELHPVPVHWPSSRADCLSEKEKKNPYTTVVGSNKKRKASAIPRPLNSFMIFAQYLRRIILHWFPDAPNAHISQRVGQLWRKLDLKMRDKYMDEAFRLQQLHAIEFPDYKYKPKKRARNVNSDDNKIETDERVPKSEVVIPIISKSMTSNNNNNSKMHHENVTFPVDQNFSTSLNNQNSDEKHPQNQTPMIIGQNQSSTVNSITCCRNYLQSNSQVNNKLNMELYQPVKVDYNYSNTTRVGNPYDKRVFISPAINDNYISKENEEVDEKMTLLVSDSGDIEHVTCQLHKIIPCQTIDGITESLILPSSLSQENQIKEIRILNMHSPTVQQLANEQPIIYHTFLCEPLKATVIRQSTVIPIKTNSSMLNGMLLDTNMTNLSFQPFVTQTTGSTTSYLYPNSYKIGFNHDKVNPLSEISLGNIQSQYGNLPSTCNHNLSYPREKLSTKYVRKDSQLLNFKQGIGDKRKSTATDLYGGDEKFLGMLSSRHTNTSLFVESLKSKCENDNVDTALSFNDIETCKSGTSLDELEQITLFSCDSNNEFLQTIDPLNLPTENSPLALQSASINNCQQTKLPPKDSALRTDTFTHPNGLPSIESWTFGASKSFQPS
ncbi:unnamed protein product [Schistosoma rodhaini]|uniref:Sex-determining region Y protein n=1 Tax=Schistosoma rodhaini TaxID=6188 RepID=A0AA85EK81_9TREM|nr:unnamed protein product [Schistosoma rodhaini]